MASGIVQGISVIICAYTEERWHQTVAAVESIQRQTLPPREIIVVIDHNTQLFERAKVGLPGTLVIENCRPKGLSGARNSGIAMARGDLIAFLDDDAIADPDWLFLLSQCFVDKQVIGAGGASEPLWVNGRPSWFPEEFYWVVGCSYLGLPRGLSVVRNPYGGCMCFRREVFDVVGGFRDDIGRVGTRPLGGEETELCIRASQHWPQKIFLYQPQARIRHCVPSHRATWRYFCSRCYAEGLSKAVISKYAGAKDTLSSERRYVLQQLPWGIVRELIDSCFHSNESGFMRAGAIVVGFTMTIAGYIAETASRLFF